ncbi:MAG: DNA repair protein RecO, partial [Gemmataceae bacterium]
MPAITLDALIVRGTDWSETSRIVTLFTREQGKVRGLAKGGRRLSSTFEMAFDLLNRCAVGVILTPGESLNIITEALVKERFAPLRAELRSLYAGYYVAELLAEGTQEEDPHSELFDAACAFLRTSPTTLEHVAAFELVWLRELGYSPRLDSCAVCGKVVPPEATQIGFS